MQSAYYFYPILIKIEFSQQSLEKPSSIKLHKNPSNTSQAVECGWRDQRTGMMKLTVAFCNLADAPKNFSENLYCRSPKPNLIRLFCIVSEKKCATGCQTNTLFLYYSTTDFVIDAQNRWSCHGTFVRWHWKEDLVTWFDKYDIL
jgi:hypothetical protein